jgi:hypothetical protein
MTTPDWSSERSIIRKRFASGDIVKSTRKELEWYLVVLVNSREAPPRFDQETHENTIEAFAVVIRHLLQVRLGEELHWRSIKVSVIAVLISLVAAGFAGFDLWEKYERPSIDQSILSVGTNQPSHK